MYIMYVSWVDSAGIQSWTCRLHRQLLPHASSGVRLNLSMEFGDAPQSCRSQAATE